MYWCNIWIKHHCISKRFIVLCKELTSFLWLIYATTSVQCTCRSEFLLGTLYLDEQVVHSRNINCYSHMIAKSERASSIVATITVHVQVRMFHMQDVRRPCRLDFFQKLIEHAAFLSNRLEYLILHIACFCQNFWGHSRLPFQPSPRPDRFE